MSERKVGTCPVCGEKAPVVNHAVERDYEVGYLGRHRRRGVRRDAKCRGSFGPWTEKKAGRR